MALAIKAIPTLYGEEARRFQDMADETERQYDISPKRDIKKILAIVQCAQYSKGQTLIINSMGFLEDKCILDLIRMTFLTSVILLFVAMMIWMNSLPKMH